MYNNYAIWDNVDTIYRFLGANFYFTPNFLFYNVFLHDIFLEYGISNERDFERNFDKDRKSYCRKEYIWGNFKRIKRKIKN